MKAAHQGLDVADGLVGSGCSRCEVGRLLVTPLQHDRLEAMQLLSDRARWPKRDLR